MLIEACSMRPQTLKLKEDIRDAAQFLLDDAAGETWDSYTIPPRVGKIVMLSS